MTETVTSAPNSKKILLQGKGFLDRGKGFRGIENEHQEKKGR